MKTVIVRFSAKIGISDSLYSELNKSDNPENTPAAIVLEKHINDLLCAETKFEQIYDSWDEAGH